MRVFGTCLLALVGKSRESDVEFIKEFVAWRPDHLGAQLEAEHAVLTSMFGTDAPDLPAILASVKSKYPDAPFEVRDLRKVQGAVLSVATVPEWFHEILWETVPAPIGPEVIEALIKAAHDPVNKPHRPALLGDTALVRHMAEHWMAFCILPTFNFPFHRVCRPARRVIFGEEVDARVLLPEPRAYFITLLVNQAHDAALKRRGLTPPTFDFDVLFPLLV